MEVTSVVTLTLINLAETAKISCIWWLVQ